MDLGEVVVALAGIVMVWSITISVFRFATQKKNLGSSSGEVERLNAVVGQMNADMQKLRDRVGVLEKLVTDDDRKLADEIERLRRNPGSHTQP